ncbi:MAG TPA: hypothetical protein VEC99_04385 [Clostridia bacterium]|nr:hypothetical protein [Clostridia bacterium]
MAINASLFRRVVEGNNYIFRNPNVLTIGIGHKTATESLLGTQKQMDREAAAQLEGRAEAKARQQEQENQLAMEI